MSLELNKFWTRQSINAPRLYGLLSVSSQRELTERILMKKAIISLLTMSVVSISSLISAQTSNKENDVRKAVQSFYDAFNAHGFDRANEFTTEDWNHINPFGGRTRGRSATASDLKRVHSTFLKGVSDTVEEIDVRFADADVAVVTVISRVGTYVTPDGNKHENERHIRTFVVVRRNARWLIMHDQNTIIEP
jgi:uncharacterized protein (TIGR02246 family)